MASGNGNAAAPAADPQLSPPSGPKDVDSEFGFKRPEMHSAKLVGSVREYNVHVFAVVEQDVMEWPKNVGTPDFSPLAAKLDEALKARKADIPRKVKYTVVEGKGVGEPAGTVLLLPDMIKYTGLSPASVDQFVNEALVGAPEKTLSSEALAGAQLFVCAHNSHDRRCGVCGPPLVDVLRAQMQQRGVAGTVWPCSHIGGHKYAGNLIAYTHRPDGTVGGDWYGYVTPQDVPTLLDAFAKGSVVDPLWRGAVNMNEEAQKAALAARQESCGASCQCTAAPSSEVVPALPAKWDASTKLAVAATVAAAVALGVAWYLRSRQPGSP